MSLLEETDKAVKAAKHLTTMDDGAIEALRAVARKIDAWDQIVQYAMDDLAGMAKGARPAVPQNDNVSLATYFKAAEQLGLTPSGRGKLEQKSEGASGTLGKLRSAQAGRAA